MWYPASLFGASFKTVRSVQKLPCPQNLNLSKSITDIKMIHFYGDA
jgi:hypothetical protein